MVVFTIQIYSLDQRKQENKIMREAQQKKPRYFTMFDGYKKFFADASIFLDFLKVTDPVQCGCEFIGDNEFDHIMKVDSDIEERD